MGLNIEFRGVMGCAWRRVLLLTLLVWLVVAGPAWGQLRVGFHSAVGVSQMRTDGSGLWAEEGWSLPTFAFEVGGTLDYTLRMGWFGLGVSTGLEFLRRAGYERRAYEVEGRYTIRSATKEYLSLYYLEVPLMLRVGFDIGPTCLFMMGGVQGGMGVYGRQRHRVEVQNPEYPTGPDDSRREVQWGRGEGQVERWHLAAVARLGLEFLDDFALFGYYELGLSRMAHLAVGPPWMRRQSYGLGFTFFFLRYPPREESGVRVVGPQGEGMAG